MRTKQEQHLQVREDVSVIVMKGYCCIAAERRNNISYKLSKFLRRNLVIFNIKVFFTIVSIFIVISSRTHGVTVIGVGSLIF